MSKHLEALRAEVANFRSVAAAAAALIMGLGAKLREAVDNDDDAALDDIISSLEAGDSELATAVTANTPAAPIADAEEGTAVIAEPGGVQIDDGTVTQPEGGNESVTGGQGNDAVQGEGATEGETGGAATQGAGASDDGTGDDADVNTQ